MKEDMLLETRQNNREGQQHHHPELTVSTLPSPSHPSLHQQQHDPLLVLLNTENIFSSTRGTGSSSSMPPSIPGVNKDGYPNATSTTGTNSKSPELGQRFHNLTRAHTLPYSPPSVFFRFNQDHIPSEWSFAFKKSILATTSSSQGTLTTDDTFKILTANDFICHSIQLAEEELIGTSLLNLISEPYRQQHLNLMHSRVHQSGTSLGPDAVLVCGSTIRLQSKDRRPYSASLWLKEQRRENKPVIYIWVFEELEENHSNFLLDIKTGRIVEAGGCLQKVFGYSSSELINRSLTDILPRISQNGDGLDLNHLKNLRFFGGRNRRGFNFPIVVKMDQEIEHYDDLSESFQKLTTREGLQQIQISAMPHIAGAITIYDSGRIHSVNDVFAKYLCGRSASSLIGTALITDILSDFWQVFPDLRQSRGQQAPSPSIKADDTLEPLSALGSPRLSSVAFSWTRLSSTGNASLHSSVSMFAKHRDGSEFPVDVHVRPLLNSQTTDTYIFAVWITFIGNFGVLADAISSFGDGNTLPHIETSVVPGGQMVSSPVLRKMSLPVMGARSREFLNQTEVTLPPPQEPQQELELAVPERNPSPSPEPPTSAFLTSLRRLSTPFHSAERSTTSWTIDDFQVIKSLGEGAYGFVRLAHHVNDPEKNPFVIKYIVKNKVLSWTRRQDLGGKIPVEVAILADLAKHPHPNIVQMTDFFEDEFFVYLIMPHKGSIDLFEYIESVEALAEETVRHIFKQVALGVKHLHDRSIVHRDIKDENVILDSDNNATLVDFGSSAYLEKKKFSTFYGTMDFASPEVLEGNPYDGIPQDIWALGILLYTLIYRENPFYCVDEILKDCGLRIPFVLSEGSLDLIQKMLSREASSRPSIEDVLSHPWLTSS